MPLIPYRTAVLGVSIYKTQWPTIEKLGTPEFLAEELKYNICRNLGFGQKCLKLQFTMCGFDLVYVE